MDDSNPDSIAWVNLVAWVQKHGGLVDGRLVLRSEEPKAATTYRGVFASAPIPNGALLISVPGNLSINGHSMPCTYHTGERRAASCWLRTLAAFLQAKKTVTSESPISWTPYLQSLPTTYETLWCWNESELEVLKGVQSPTVPISSSTTASWKINRQELETRFRQIIHPYFQSVGFPDIEFDSFAEVCQLVSTRGFHDILTQAEGDHGRSAPGPYLLPVIDLLNHGEGPAIATSLHRNKNGDFVMVAERSIDSGEEILHSYGPQLTSSQFLATFGFVPTSHSVNSTAHNLLLADSVTPSAVIALSKDKDIAGACYSIIADTQAIDDLAESILSRDPLAEVWEIPSATTRVRQEIGDDDDVIFLDPTALREETSQLSDELVTAFCRPFLPDCARDELTSNTLLDSSMLQDPFLGKLVGKAMILLADRKLASYGKVCITESEQKALPDKDNPCNDIQLLSTLLQMPSLTVQQERFKYALTVRLQEMRAFVILQRKGEQLVESLDEPSNQHKRRRVESTGD